MLTVTIKATCDAPGCASFCEMTRWQDRAADQWYAGNNPDALLAAAMDAASGYGWQRHTRGWTCNDHRASDLDPTTTEDQP